ncbi:MAG: anti-sigma factor [Nitrospira sp.]|nr:anti-sigma factor [Nitrospira sp.]MBH0184796.1 anti-sigma factor [Nitrospira sp.]
MTDTNTEEPAREMTCQEVAEWTSAYLDAHAGEDRNVRIALHLASCAGCEAYVKQIVAIRDLVGSLPETAMIPPLPDTLRQALTARQRRQ